MPEDVNASRIAWAKKLRVVSSMIFGECDAIEDVPAFCVINPRLFLCSGTFEQTDRRAMSTRAGMLTGGSQSGTYSVALSQISNPGA